ncbi:hypothetical protein EVAR_3478_1 [Eumeta japonica]|uniref:Uncharacterized protein n=1 Tax=Eumeta variegata TaxID=151549 RepID=A0A4C1SVB5_EUMVA|nr:hypothetical protein EVAR_3478_1 [Eumeta japonica]
MAERHYVLNINHSRISVHVLVYGNSRPTTPCSLHKNGIAHASVCSYPPAVSTEHKYHVTALSAQSSRRHSALSRLASFVMCHLPLKRDVYVGTVKCEGGPPRPEFRNRT